MGLGQFSCVCFVKIFIKLFTTHQVNSGPTVAILGADQKERGLWGRECFVYNHWAFAETAQYGLETSFSPFTTRVTFSSSGIYGAHSIVKPQLSYINNPKYTRSNVWSLPSAFF